MTTAAIKTAKALWKTLLPHLRKLGRWLLRRLETKGVKKLLAFMELRIDTFADRVERTKSGRRKRWLRGRIKRWTAAMKWLTKHAKKLLSRVTKALAKKADPKTLEWDAPGESYTRWKRAAA